MLFAGYFGPTAWDPGSIVGTYSCQADGAEFDALIGEHLFYIVV